MTSDQQRIEREWIDAAATRDAHDRSARQARRAGRWEEAALQKGRCIEAKRRCEALEAEFRALAGQPAP